MSSTIGRRYARALLDLSVEAGQGDKVGRDLSDLAKTWEESRELRDLFESPDYSQDMRRKVVDGLASRMGMTDSLKNTLHLLSDRRETAPYGLDGATGCSSVIRGSRGRRRKLSVLAYTTVRISSRADAAKSSRLKSRLCRSNQGIGS